MLFAGFVRSLRRGLRGLRGHALLAQSCHHPPRPAQTGACGVLGQPGGETLVVDKAFASGLRDRVINSLAWNLLA